MNLESLRKHAANRPGATVDVKWGADECVSVGGRMFTVFGIDRGRARNVAFKVESERFLELTDRPGIIPAPYLARAHWVLVEDAKALPDAEARAFVERSHALVTAKLPRRLRDAIAAPAAAPVTKARR
jgi:predicted DNA-binding protein (MmcQ/YjbR family)